MTKLCYIKKALPLLIILLLVGCFPQIKLEHTSPPMKETLGKGKIVVGTINNLRKSGYGQDNFELLGVLRSGVGVPFSYYTEKGYGINIALNNLLKDVLSHSGYDVSASDSEGKMPILEADVITFWGDGYLGYQLASEIKLRLLSSDKRTVLLEKILKNEHEVSYVTSSRIAEAFPIFIDEIFKNSVDFIKSEEFNKAYKRSF